MTKHIKRSMFKGDDYCFELHRELMQVIHRHRHRTEHPNEEVHGDTRSSDMTAVLCAMAVLTLECQDRNEFSLMSTADIAAELVKTFQDNPNVLEEIR